MSTNTAPNLNVNTFIKNNPDISASVNTESTDLQLNRSSLRVKNYFAKRKLEQKTILAAVVGKLNDMRPYASLQILGKNIIGLMDKGASISCVGGGFAAELKNNKENVKSFATTVRTADGQQQNVVAKIITNITFKGESKPIVLYVVPTLLQNLYLGIDF